LDCLKPETTGHSERLQGAKGDIHSVVLEIRDSLETCDTLYERDQLSGMLLCEPGAAFDGCEEKGNGSRREMDRVSRLRQ
jgi:hypothetical protein